MIVAKRKYQKMGNNIYVFLIFMNNVCCSVKLVEQELWQREEKGLIGILPVRDSAETATSGTAVSSGDLAYSECYYQNNSCSKSFHSETYLG